MPLCFRALATTLVLLATPEVDLLGQQLLELDGVELRGNAQLVLSGGGTCNVFESDTSYEERQENHGAPMDIWRLDFAVHNGSGRWLDHLIARFQIDSAWPECTNWDVPQARRFAQPIEWTGSNGHIQQSGRNVVAPGETLTHTKYFIVLRRDPEPRFENWSVDFDFAAAPPAVTGSPASAPPISAEQDVVFWQSIMNSTNPAEFQAYLAQFPSGVFRALAEARLAELRSPTGDPPTSAESRLPICTKESDGDSCWMELTNQPGCYVWNPNPHPNEIVTWTAECAAGAAQGTGTLTWLYDGTVERAIGRVLGGRFLDGSWVVHGPDGAVVGSTDYVNGAATRQP